MHNNKYTIPPAEFPESTGVSSAVLKEFLDGMEAAGLEYHSLTVVRHGKIAFSFYNKPFGADVPHAMYSVSKTWTGTAVGFAVHEGYFALDTKVLDIFPEYRTKKFDENAEKLTVRHLLTMSSGKKIPFFSDKSKVDWLKQFFESPWAFSPGEKFQYTNENIYLLCAIIRRTTGQTVREFLTPRLFEPLGMETPIWETDPNGTEAGGWGLYVTADALTKLMLCYANGGKLGDKQILPAEWAREATKTQICGAEDAPLDASEYGYCIWRVRTVPNAYRADGMFGQFSLVMKDYDAVITVTGANADEGRALDYLLRFFPRAFKENASARITPEALAAYTERFSLEHPEKSVHSPLENEINGKTISVRGGKYLRRFGVPFSILPLPVTVMAADKAGNPDKLQLRFVSGAIELTWSEGKEKNRILCGTDGKMRYGKMTLGKAEYPVCAHAKWVSDTVLELHIRPYTTVVKRILRLEFKGKHVILIPSGTPSLLSIADCLGGWTISSIKSSTLQKAVLGTLHGIARLLEPKLKGKIR